MAADDEISGKYRVVRASLSGSRDVVLGERSHKDLNQTSPEKAFYVNGGAPVGSGRTVPAPQAVFQPGQRMAIELNPVTTKTLDTIGGTSADLRVGIMVRDHATGELVPRVLTESDRSQTYVADDGSKTAAVWNPAWEFLVPHGETWQLYGELKIRSSTTA